MERILANVPYVIFGPEQRPALDGSVRGAAYAFLERLRADDTAPGLHIEPINGTADARVRTGRVNKFWRAVLVKLTAAGGGDAHYVYLGTYPHDDAIDFAKKACLRVNPISSALELLREQPVAPVLPERYTDPSLYRNPATAPADDSVREALLPTPLLVRRKVSMRDLLDLGVDASLAEEAVGALDDDAMLRVVLAHDTPRWQGEAILEVAAGTPLTDVRAMYEVRPATGDRASDEALLTAVTHPASQMEFAYIEDDEVLRAAIEDPDFGRWRVFLHPEQRAYAYGPRSGSFRLSGRAGTGKTVVLLHRARSLATANPDARIVLTTFNRTLADALKANLRLLDKDVRLAAEPGEPGIYVGTVDAVSWRLLARSKRLGLRPQAAVGVIGGPRSGDLLAATDARLWQQALRDAGWELPESLRSAAWVAAEYVQVVLPARITSQEDYQRVVRAGRGVALGRAQRQALWAVFEDYRKAAAKAGSTDYDEKALLAATTLDDTALDGGLANGRSRLADHVLVDEGQDLSPCRLLLLRALVAPGPDDLFIAEDSQQRIYGQRVVPARLGIELRGRSRRLTLNYRTTAQTLRYAVGVLDGIPAVDMENSETSTTGYRSSRSGPVPKESGFRDLDDAYDAAAATIQGWIESGDTPESVAVLVRAGHEGTMLVDALEQRGTSARYVGPQATPGKDRVPVMTMHRSKGMEFKRVVLFGLSSDAVPAAVASVPDDEQDDALQKERSLLYVAATRARDELVVMWDGDRSGLLPDRA